EKAPTSSEKSPSPKPSANKTPEPKPAPEPEKQGGDFIWPAAGGVTSSYGTRVNPKTGQTKLHAGIDVGSPVGTTLTASSSGVVLTAGTMNGYGKTIMISHSINGKTYTTLFAHLNDINVSSGQAVSQGDVIGATGNTGMST